MPFWPCWIPETELWQAMGVLARWFRFQPSEIDALTLDDLRRWLEVAREQMGAG